MNIHDKHWLPGTHWMREWENKNLSGIEPRASRLPDENFTTAPHKIAHGPQANLTEILEIFEDGR